MAITSTNPHTGERLRSYEPLPEAERSKKLQRALEAFHRHRETSFAERAQKLTRAAALLERDQEALARQATLEMGKLLSAARAEVEKCAWVCRYYAEEGARHLADEAVELGKDAGRAFVRYQPLGPVLAVMPWNFPYWQVFRFAAPALMAGNVGLLKHASNVPGCALAIERVLVDAGFGEGCFQTLLVPSQDVPALIADERVKAVTLTGSEAAGRDVGGHAGRALKKVVLELGGSDPFVVLPSADLARAAETAVKARVLNNGQSCIAAKRFIVHERVYDAFLERFVAGMKALEVGDPLEPGTGLGPLATPSIRDELHEQVQRSLAQGARVLCGGRPLPGKGNHYEATVLVDVPRDSPAYREELFGPVATVLRARDLDDAVRLANDTRYGLGASAWTTDPREQAVLAERLEAGSVFMNAMVASDPRLPFGGVKASGVGRELGVHGIREFVNVKTVRIA